MLSVPLLAIAAAAQSPDASGTAVAYTDGRLVVAVETDLTPGPSVGVHVTELRDDPRTGEPVAGLRYAGDGRVVWAGPGLVEIALAAPEQTIRVGEPVVLGAPLGLEPSPERAPAPIAVAAPGGPAGSRPPPPDFDGQAAPEWAAEAEEPATDAGDRPNGSGPFAALNTDLDGAPLGHVRDGPDQRWGGRRQSVVAWGGFAGAGYETGVGAGGLAWRWHPAAGPGRVEVGLEGLRASRWIKGAEDEPFGREIAAGYWLWTRVDGAATGLAPFGGVGLGVDVEGLGVATLIGLRSGDPAGSRVELAWDQRGRLGQRLVLDGRAALAEGAQVGVRSRVGDVPKNDPGLRRWRTDGAIVGSFDLSNALTVDLAAGLGGYDLTWADAAPVLDAALEVRW